MAAAPLAVLLNLVREAKGIGGMASALPSKREMTYLRLRFNLNPWLKIFTLPCPDGFFPPKGWTARDLCL